MFAPISSIPLPLPLWVPWCCMYVLSVAIEKKSYDRLDQQGYFRAFAPYCETAHASGSSSVCVWYSSVYQLLCVLHFFFIWFVTWKLLSRTYLSVIRTFKCLILYNNNMARILLSPSNKHKGYWCFFICMHCCHVHTTINVHQSTLHHNTIVP